MVARISASTPRRYEALAYIMERIRTDGISPSFGEIAAYLKVSIARVKQYVQQLIVEGLIAKSPGAQRSLIIRDHTRARQAMVNRLRELGATAADPLGAMTPYPQGQLPSLPAFTYLPD